MHILPAIPYRPVSRGPLSQRGAMPSLRFNTHNVHKQCSACNNHLSGNMIEYRINLIAK